MAPTAGPYSDHATGLTGGWSGSSTSRDRARRRAADGTASKNQRETLALMRERGQDGITVSELRSALEVHHGTASGVLSNLHAAGTIARLRMKRSGSMVYVLPEHVNGRITEAQGRKPKMHGCPSCGHHFSEEDDTLKAKRSRKTPASAAEADTGLLGEEVNW